VIVRSAIVGGLVVLAVAAVLSVGASHALWRDQATYSGATITAGDLDLVRDGQVTWQQVTPGVADPASGVLGGTPTSFRTMPGDVVRISYPFEVKSKGDNLSVALSVDFAAGQAPSPAGAVSTTFHVEDAAGTASLPATGDVGFGQVVNLPVTNPGSAGAVESWTVVVTVRVLGDYQWQGAPSTDFLDTWSAGTFAITATQVRTDGAVA